MKKHIFRLTALLFAILAAGCSKESTTPAVFPGDVTLHALKTGAGSDGRPLQLEVESNAFWQLFADEQQGWVTASPKAAQGDATITFTVLPNTTGGQRTAQLTLRRQDGMVSRITLIQDAGDQVICYLSEAFGIGSKEQPVADYTDWQTKGIGVGAIEFVGADAAVGSASPSLGYEAASGGANVVMKACGATFTLGPVDVSQGLDFRLLFGAYAADGFDPAQLVVSASKNGTHWANVSYGRSAKAGWEVAESRFYLSDDIRQLWFRFEAAEAGLRIDDILLREGEQGEAQLLELGGELAAPAEMKAAATETTLTFSWGAVRNAAGYQYECYKQEQLVATGKSTLNSATVAGLETGVVYRFRVRALPAEGSIYLDSPYSEFFSQQTKGYMPQPQVWLFRRTQGMLVFEWTRKTPGLGRRYSLELLDAQGSVLRSYERVNYSGNATYDNSYIYNRQVFGGLKADTEYTLRVQYLTESADYNDSEWGSFAVRTAPTPVLPDGCLLYKDFETAWFGGSSIDVAWGAFPKEAQLNLDYGNEEAFAISIVYPIRCMEDSFNATKLPDQYRRKYWAGWDWSDIGEPAAAKANSGIFMICGALKFGSGSAYGRLTTSKLGSYGLTGETDVTVSFKAAPYYEPNLTTGSLQNSPYIICGNTLAISIWSGSGRFENGQTTLTLTNLKPDQTDADAKTCYSWTEHSVKIVGADASTRVSISTIAQKGHYRMWFDDLMIVRTKAPGGDDTTGGGTPGYGDGGDGFPSPGSGGSDGSMPGYGDGGSGFDGSGGQEGQTPGYGDGGDGYSGKTN